MVFRPIFGQESFARRIPATLPPSGCRKSAAVHVPVIKRLPESS
jgi:hypothetical protein